MTWCRRRGKYNREQREKVRWRSLARAGSERLTLVVALALSLLEAGVASRTTIKLLWQHTRDFFTV